MTYLVVTANLLFHSVPRCQDCTPRDAQVVARVIAHEARFDSPDDEAGIYEVLMRTRARVRAVSKGRGSLAFAADQYSGVATGARTARDDLDRWSAGLRDENAYTELVARVTDLFRGEARSPCPVPPHHWGGPMDVPRARRMGFRRIPCGSSRNDFYLMR